MNRDTQHARKQPAPPDLGAEAAQLRELTRQAHEAARDLRTAVTDARRVLGELDQRVDQATARALDRSLAATVHQWDKLSGHMRAEMDKATLDLAAQVTAAREHIVQALLMSRLVPDAGNDALIVEWSTTNFAPEGQPGDNQTVILDY